MSFLATACVATYIKAVAACIQAAKTVTYIKAAPRAFVEGLDSASLIAPAGLFGECH